MRSVKRDSLPAAEAVGATASDPLASVPDAPDAAAPGLADCATAEPAAITQATPPDSSLQRFGLTVASRTSSDGAATFTVSGDTFPARVVLRELGGHWDSVAQVWRFTGTDPTPQIADRLAGKPATHEGLADSAAAVAISPGQSNHPHYWGHRQRLRDRFLSGDDTGLPDYELLELLLFFSIERIDTKPLSKALLSRFGSLAGAINASVEQLKEFEGVNHFTISLFKAVRILAARIVREDLTERPLLDNWDALVAYLRATMAHLMIEQFRLLFLDRRNVLIADEVQQRGTIDHTPVYTREVVKRALALDASAIVMVHNHPTTPCLITLDHAQAH